MAWNPWRELRHRPHIRFRLTPLPDGVEAAYARRDGRAAIVVHAGLERRQRAAALAHELVHDEHRDGETACAMPPSWEAVIHRHEARIDREVARRLVDAEELAEFVEGRRSVGDPVFARDVADWFDVAEWVAQGALELLRARQRLAG